MTRSGAVHLSGGQRKKQRVLGEDGGGGGGPRGERTGLGGGGKRGEGEETEGEKRVRGVRGEEGGKESCLKHQ